LLLEHRMDREGIAELTGDGREVVVSTDQVNNRVFEPFGLLDMFEPSCFDRPPIVNELCPRVVRKMSELSQLANPAAIMAAKEVAT